MSTFAGLWDIVVPVVISFIIMAGGAWAVRRYAGPVQAAYVGALEGRMKILQSERDELRNEVETLRDEVADLRIKVEDLERQIRVLLSENLHLRRRLPLEDDE